MALGHSSTVCNLQVGRLRSAICTPVNAQKLQMLSFAYYSEAVQCDCRYHMQEIPLTIQHSCDSFIHCFGIFFCPPLETFHVCLVEMACCHLRMFTTQQATLRFVTGEACFSVTGVWGLCVGMYVGTFQHMCL